MACTSALNTVIGSCFFVLFMLGAACSGADPFQGTTLKVSDPAPDFQLHDQFGQTVSLSDYLGKPVVITFLYTNCDDICPIVTKTIHSAHHLLGDTAENVIFLAISVDPSGDTVEDARNYSASHDMQYRWKFLVGSEDELKSVWQSYWIAPVQGGVVGLNEEMLGSAPKQTLDDPIGHTAPIFLIDHQGYRRVVFTNLFLDPIPLVHDIRILVGYSGS